MAPWTTTEDIYLIAEIASNHNRDFETATKLIDMAARCGCHAVKFQTYTADGLYSRFAPRLSEMEGRTKDNEKPWELINRLTMPWEWYDELFAYTRHLGLEVFSSPFELGAVDFLEAKNVNLYKIASYEISDNRLIAAIAETGKPIILSTGNSSLNDIERALHVIEGKGQKNELVLLHCVSQYPAQHSDMNIRALKTLHHAFGYPVGLSDHTEDAIAAICAIALGAIVIEKHITLDRSSIGPDHPFSLDEGMLQRFVQTASLAKKTLGSGRKAVQRSENENHLLARRSLHARIDLPQLTPLSLENTVIKRPGLGIDPYLWPVVSGREIQIPLKKDQWITWDHIFAKKRTQLERTVPIS